MTKKCEVYRCQVCGNVVEVLHPGAQMSCCGQPMTLLRENTADGAREKHVPVVEPVSGGWKVAVGSVEHPTTAEHHIQWIELFMAHGMMRRELCPGDKPEAVFLAADCPLCVRAYCNLHGLWRKDVG